MSVTLNDLEMQLLHITADEAVRLLDTIGTNTVTEAILLGHLKNTLADLDCARDGEPEEVTSGDT